VTGAEIAGRSDGGELSQRIRVNWQLATDY